MFPFVGLDVAAITKLVVETVRERDETEFTHHSQTLETGTTKVQSRKQLALLSSVNQMNDKQRVKSFINISIINSLCVVLVKLCGVTATLCSDRRT